MDWVGAIEVNRAALSRIVAGLVAFLAAQGQALRLPLPVYREIALALHRAESAVRRLIVVAARGLVVPLRPTRPMPKGLVIAGKGQQRRMAFQLFDNRQSFPAFSEDQTNETAITGPRIRMIGDTDPRSLFLAKFTPTAATRSLSSESETQRLRLRLAAIERALGNLQREARRMVQWKARRARMEQPAFTSPIRPGPPPGRRKRSKDEIDSILTECHGLAWDVLTADTS